MLVTSFLCCYDGDYDLVNNSFRIIRFIVSKNYLEQFHVLIDSILNFDRIRLWLNFIITFGIDVIVGLSVMVLVKSCLQTKNRE